VALYESKRAGVRHSASGINHEEKNLAAMKARRRNKEGQISEKQIVKHLENMEFTVSKEASRPQQKADSSYLNLF
tara:strand:- start:452 stop:676 length:225 start_codon:yes stop_codon:yes gene_type:complete